MVLSEMRLVALRELMGWIENGTSTTVTFSQDDATKAFCLKVGDKSYYDESFGRVIDRAARAELASNADQ